MRKRPDLIQQPQSQAINIQNGQQQQQQRQQGVVQMSAPTTFNFMAPMDTINPQMLQNDVMLMDDQVFGLDGIDMATLQLMQETSTSPLLSSSPIMHQQAQQSPNTSQSKPIRKVRGNSSVSASQDIANSYNTNDTFPNSLSNETINEGSGSLSKHISEVEKRRKRRESHNAVERRRRDNINDRIQDLSTLVPVAMLSAVDPTEDAPADGKIHKGLILKRSVEYIQMLQQENQVLKQRLSKYEHV